MLGLSQRAEPWRWKAAGKHPAASDYISTQEGTPILAALADWVAKGYAELQRRALMSQNPCSFRFWLRGARKGNLICGLCRDSSDRIGRPFPLLIVGEGPLKGWEERWGLLPAMLSKVWHRTERLAVKNFDDLKGLIEDLGQLGSPRSDSDMAEPPASADNRMLAGDLLRLCPAELRRTGRTFITLGHAPVSDPAEEALHWHLHLQACGTEVPRAVFLGGTAQRACLSVSMRPITTDDFVKLWQVGQGAI